ncbi:hypothetical protein CDEN61S_01244 [Castellaniella denitrificans]
MFELLQTQKSARAAGIGARAGRGLRRAGGRRTRRKWRRCRRPPSCPKPWVARAGESGASAGAAPAPADEPAAAEPVAEFVSGAAGRARRCARPAPGCLVGPPGEAADPLARAGPLAPGTRPPPRPRPPGPGWAACGDGLTRTGQRPGRPVHRGQGRRDPVRGTRKPRSSWPDAGVAATEKPAWQGTARARAAPAHRASPRPCRAAPARHPGRAPEGPAKNPSSMGEAAPMAVMHRAGQRGGQDHFASAKLAHALPGTQAWPPWAWTSATSWWRPCPARWNWA